MIAETDVDDMLAAKQLQKFLRYKTGAGVMRCTQFIVLAFDFARLLISVQRFAYGQHQVGFFPGFAQKTVKPRGINRFTDCFDRGLTG